jgi:seryl-tRNA synthetase
MYDIKWIRENPDAFDRGLARRHLSDKDRERFSAEALLNLDEERRKAIGYLENALARRNAASKEVAEAKRRKDDAHAEDLVIEVTQLKKIIPELEKTPKELEAKLFGLLAQIPNMPLDDVPDGKDEHGNVERSKSGEKGSYNFTPKQHFELGEALGMMDFELAAKLSGARFVVLQKGLARLERAIGQFFLDVHTTEHGYTEVNPPLLVRDHTMFGTAQLPKFKEDQYFGAAPVADENALKTLAEIAFEQFLEARAKYSNKRSQEPNIFRRYLHDIAFEKAWTNTPALHQWLQNIILAQEKHGFVKTEDRLWLIPTAEVPLTNLVRESMVAEDELPMRLTACTPCFRAEAGAAGKDTRGMIRQHQFTKVELVSITTPERSRDEHERMLACAEAVLKKLDLPYRVMTLCTGDMGFASQKTYDIEVWLPGQNMYREISSCSVCGDFQARRMNARFRAKDGKPQFVHTLNGSGVAVGRALIAVMENYQQENGAIAVPNALAPYMGGMQVIERAQ